MNKIETMMADKIKEVKSKAQHLIRNPNDLFKPQRRVIARKLRQAVTGDEKKRIRDLLKEKKKEPTNTKLFDKISFTLVRKFKFIYSYSHLKLTYFYLKVITCSCSCFVCICNREF